MWCFRHVVFALQNAGVLGWVLNAATVLTLGRILNGAVGPDLGLRLKSAAIDRSVL